MGSFFVWKIKIQRQSVQNLEHHQNIMICSLAHWQNVLKMLLKSVYNFSSPFASSQTNKRRGSYYFLFWRRQLYIKTIVTVC